MPRAHDSLKGHGRVDGDESGDGADAEGHPGREVLPRTRGAEDELLERCVRREAHGGVGPCGPVNSGLTSGVECNTLPHHL